MSRVLLASPVVLALILSATAAENEPLSFRHVAISSSVGDPTAFPREVQKLLAGVRECDSKVSGGPPCAHAYSSEDHSALIVEVCRSVRNYAPGLYIFRAGQKWQYPWFDARFMAWACME